MKTWILAVLLVVPCAAQEDEAPAEESIQAPVGARHYESADADQAPQPQAAESAPAASVVPSGYEAHGISRRLGVPRPPARTPSRASGGSSANPAGAATVLRVVARPFLTGYVGVPYIANMAIRTSLRIIGDDSFGYDLYGPPSNNVFSIFSSTDMPPGLAAVDAWLPGLQIRGAVLGVPLRAGNFFPHVKFDFGIAYNRQQPFRGKFENFNGPVGLRILPEPRYTVLNPDERSNWDARFENDGPALLKVTLEGNPYGSMVRSADGVTTERVYFEARVLALGGDRMSRVGVDGGRLLGETARIGEGDSWAYDFSGVVMLPQDGTARAHLKSRVGTSSDGEPGLIQVPAIVSGDTVMVAFDPVAGYLWFGKNGRWLEGGDPAAGGFPTVDGITLPAASHHSDFRAAVQGASGPSGGTTVVMNFGDQPWRYAPPRGFGGIRHRRATGLHPRQ